MKLLGYTITAYLVQLATGLLLFIPIGLGIAITHPETHRFVVLLNDVTLWVIAPLAGGYMAIHGTVKLFKIKSIRDLYISYVSSYTMFNLTAILVLLASSESIKIMQVIQLIFVLLGSFVAKKQLEA
jgi:ACR3 family arsenite efflux pump ArsB